MVGKLCGGSARSRNSSLRRRYLCRWRDQLGTTSSPGTEADLYMSMLDSTFVVSSFPSLNVENAADAMEALTTKVTVTEKDEFGGRFSKSKTVE